MIRKVFRDKFRKCKLSAPDICRTNKLANPEIFSAEKIAAEIAPRKKRCDEIVLCDLENAVGIYCIENKGNPGYSNLARIQEQLQGGANIAGTYLSADEMFQFLPVLAVEIMRHSEIKNLYNYEIKLRQKTARIRICTRSKAELPAL